MSARPARPWRWTRRARRLALIALCALAFALGSWGALWDAMPWAVTL